jgi:hypothetical protein
MEYTNTVCGILQQIHVEHTNTLCGHPAVEEYLTHKNTFGTADLSINLILYRFLQSKCGHEKSHLIYADDSVVSAS